MIKKTNQLKRIILSVILVIFLVNMNAYSYAAILQEIDQKIDETNQEQEETETMDETEPKEQVNQVRAVQEEAKVEIKYQYKEDTNTVLATIESTVELKPTKASWKLSQDKKHYTFEFDNNTTYDTTVEDVNGKIYTIHINVTEVKIVRVVYQYQENTNTVLATIESKVELKPTKASWKLSQDKKHYTFEFDNNTTYDTTVEDVNGNSYTVHINVTQVKTVRVVYQYQENTNTVLATIESKVELKPTKASWKLSQDGKKYTFEFNSNTIYDTTVEDIYGNVYTVHIEVTQIKGTQVIPKVEIKYEYNETTNTVLATIESTVELKPTKVSWKLSRDKKHYTFEFSGNTSYDTTVEDIYGKVYTIHINVTGIKETILKVEYEYNSKTNKVLAKIISNIELKPTKVSWQLSEDKLTYSFEFGSNTTYTTTITNKYGNEFTVEIKVTQIDDKPPEITMEYITNKDNSITAIMHSNEILGETKPTWTLSQDKLSYSKTFDNTNVYTTPVQDIYGNEVMVKVRVIIYDGTTSRVEDINDSKYPGYKQALQQLQKQYPNWNIKVLYTGLNWNQVISQEAGFSGGSPRCLTQAPYLNQWKEGDQKYDVSKTWYKASQSAIAYMMDPRNSLQEAWIFQFQDLSSSSGTRQEISKMTEGTFLHTNSIIDAIMTAAREEGISPFHIVSRIIQEQGSDGRGIMNGHYQYLRKNHI